MDILTNLNISTLPEQQTRTTNLNVIAALQSDPEIRLGFSHCCYCAGTPAIVSCRKCQRVKYCSDECRRNDKRSLSFARDDDDDNDSSRGHTAVICSLLQSCHDDEEEELRMMRREESSSPQTSPSTTTTTTLNQPPSSTPSPSYDRIISELESYPATLSQILSTSSTYRTALIRRKFSSFVIHIIGATKRAELWTAVFSDVESAGMAYVDALTDIVETMNLTSVSLLFIGEGLEEEEEEDISWRHVWIDDDAKTERDMIIRTKTASYHERNKNDVADVVCFFNPGFTCGDYEWDETLRSIPSGTPFFVTSNTEMEAVMDCQFLFDGGFIPKLPRMVTEMMRIEEGDCYDKEEETGGADDDDDDDKEEDLLFFGENPYCGSRVRQSGNMANDVFVKSRFVFGGVFFEGSVKGGGGGGGGKKTKKRRDEEKIKEKTIKKKTKKRRDADDDDDGPSRRKIKKKNPALI